MIDALVGDGDIIVVRPQRQVLPHEMAVIWLRENEDDDDGGTTLKYCHRETNGLIRLQPRNKKMSPKYVHPKLVEIQGKVVMVIQRPEQL
jgi:repressor LexA